MKFEVDFRSFTKKLNKHPDNGFPTGSRIYIGHQGKGKTLSMVHYTMQMRRKFPDCLIFSNVLLDLPAGGYTYFSTDKELERALEVSNGENGIIFLIDEAHLFFRKKQGIPLYVLSAISQQRKDRRRLVFSSQIWEELDISTRKQVKEVVKCRRVLNMQVNRILDGESIHYDHLQSAYVMDPLGYEIYKHNEDLYDVYDTKQKIVRNIDMLEGGEAPPAAPGAPAPPVPPRRFLTIKPRKA